MCDCNVRCDPVRVQGLTAAVLEAGCQLLLIAGCRETASAKRRRSWGATGIGGAGWSVPRPTRVRCPSRFARKPRLRAIAFLEAQFGNSGGTGYATVCHDS